MATTGAVVGIPEWTGTPKAETTTLTTLTHDDSVVGTDLVKITTGATSCYVKMDELIEAVHSLRRLVRVA